MTLYFEGLAAAVPAQAPLPKSDTLVFSARFDPKDNKWKVLVEAPSACFVVEDRMLGKALAQATLRLEDQP